MSARIAIGAPVVVLIAIAAWWFTRAEVPIGQITATTQELPALGHSLEIDPPFDGFDAYNYVPVVDGDSVLVLGAASNVTGFLSGGVSFDATNAAARFDLASATWSELPALPVSAGFNSASALDIDGQLFVLGVDCEVSDSASWQGVSFVCYSQASRFLRLSPDGSFWEQLAPPPRLDTDQRLRLLPFGASSIAVARQGVYSSDDSPPDAIVAFDSGAGTWGAPIEAPNDTGLCVVDGELVAGRIDDGTLSLWSHIDGGWQPVASPVSGPVGLARCDSTGFIVVALAEPNGTESLVEVSHVDRFGARTRLHSASSYSEGLSPKLIDNSPWLYAWAPADLLPDIEPEQGQVSILVHGAGVVAASGDRASDPVLVGDYVVYTRWSERGSRGFNDLMLVRVFER